MIFKPTNKVVKPLLLLAYVAMAAFSTNVSAAPVVIDFGTGGAAFTGTIEDVNSDGTHIKGTNIGIGVLNVTGTPANSGSYSTSAVLNFDTDLNTIEIIGSVSGITTGTQLLSGTFDTWSVSPFSGSGVSFNGAGLDSKDTLLLEYFGLDANTPFEFFGFSLGFDISGDGTITGVSTDIVNTVVPVPAAVWLFGTGLIGLVGVARRRV